MLTSARFADRIPARYSVNTGPSCQKTSPTWLAMPIGPVTGGAWVGRLTIESASLPRPSQMSVSASPVSSTAIRNASPGAFWM